MSRPRVQTAVARLTARERQIAELASSGLTSAEIGRRLYLSTRTVDSHLGRVYAKLAVANRTGLAAVLLGGAAAADPGSVPAQLPAGVPAFVGRKEHLRRLDGLLTAAGDHGPVVCAVTGTAGVGKTTLAVHWAHRVAERFPDGLLHVDLRGFHPSVAPLPAAGVIRDFLIALAVPADRIPSGPQALAALYRTTLAGRRVLLLLDNAHDAEQVRPLLPGSAGAFVLVTSRDRLTSLLTAGARHVSVDLLPDDEAVALLTARVDRRRVSAEPAAARRIIDRCARLPLAISVAAARIVTHPTFTLAGVADDLEHVHRGLDVFVSGDATTDVRAVFASSYHHLGRPEARLFRLLGLHPGPDIAAPVAAALAGLTVSRARSTLSALARAHLITEHAPGRFTVHELLHRYARELAHATDSEADRRDALNRMTDHYVAAARHAAELAGPQRRDRPDSTVEALRWYDAERPAILAAARHGLTGDRVVELACALAELFDRRGHWHDWAAITDLALLVAVRQDDQAFLHRSRARAAVWLGDPDTAHRHLQHALVRYEQVDDLLGLAHTHRTMAWFLGRRGERRAAAGHARRAVRLHRAAGDPAGQGLSLNALGWQHAHLGDYDLAARCCTEAIRLLDDAGDRSGLGHAHDSLGFVLHRRNDHAGAVAHYRQAIRLFRETGDRYNEADTLIRLGDTHHDEGNLAAAAAAWRRAEEILTDLRR